ncbi:MAG: hypothetical protein JOZ54_20170 [Acidobacteria bacterium]|nr:hypothetical protein [Acidobacteriota bacterium]
MLPRFSLLASLLFAFSAIAADRVLFVGNSLTYTNDLPAMVGRIAALGHPLETGMTPNCGALATS